MAPRQSVCRRNCDGGFEFLLAGSSRVGVLRRLIARWVAIKAHGLLSKQCSNLNPDRPGSNIVGTTVANFCFNPCQAFFIG